MDRLKDKIAVITGGSSGIGLATAKAFVDEGAKVVLFGRRQRALEEAAALIGGSVTLVVGDVSDPDDVERLFVEAASLGKIDVVFANAGIVEVDLLPDLTVEKYRRHFDINVLGPMLTLQKALPHLVDGASVIITGSIAANQGADGYSLYSASKAAVRSFARTWASELRDRGIRVNVLAPGPVDTAIMDSQARQTGGDPAELRSTYAKQVPLGRLGRPEELAAAAVFLASAESSFVTGASLDVDGGLGQI